MNTNKQPKKGTTYSTEDANTCFSGVYPKGLCKKKPEYRVIIVGMQPDKNGVLQKHGLGSGARVSRTHGR